MGNIQPDQFGDYLKRKRMDVDMMQRWLRPVME